ncbi:uncharacterized protein LOC116165353 isoform X2 [Photinus pyralis]|uniref:uncharacterized protein LOC116165353 isoform X2 n=1 Tax=Photinus pyralis TaxID=7054 RepID=UPI001266ED91|nr:uncharacterized protein LOC116165353 isoform X2 [Photinus pyralis]
MDEMNPQSNSKNESTGEENPPEPVSEAPPDNVSACSTESSSTIQACFNSMGNNLNFLAWCKGFDLNPNIARQIEESFGANTLVVLASQDYSSLTTNTWDFARIVEVYDIRYGVSMVDVVELWGSPDVTFFSCNLNSVVVIFDSVDKATVALCIKTSSFKTRKLVDASDLALTYALEQILPEGGSLGIRDYSKQLPLREDNASPLSWSHQSVDAPIRPMAVLKQHGQAITECLPRRFPQCWDTQWSDLRSKSDSMIHKEVRFAPGKVIFKSRNLDDEAGPSHARAAAEDIPPAPSCEAQELTTINSEEQSDLEKRRQQGAIPKTPTPIPGTVPTPAAPLKGILRRTRTPAGRPLLGRFKTPVPTKADGKKDHSTDKKPTTLSSAYEAVSQFYHKLKDKQQFSSCFKPSPASPTESGQQTEPTPSTSGSTTEQLERPQKEETQSGRRPEQVEKFQIIEGNNSSYVKNIYMKLTDNILPFYRFLRLSFV